MKSEECKGERGGEIQHLHLNHKFGSVICYCNRSYRMQQSSRAFKANLTISMKTGSTTHSSFDGWFFMIEDDGVDDSIVSRLWWMVVGDELGVTIWILFCLFSTIRFDFSVCLFHKFKFCECSICFNRQSSCCWLVPERIFFHWKRIRRHNVKLFESILLKITTSSLKTL